MNTPEPFNDLSWNDDPLHSPNRTEYIEKLRARVKELESICNEVSKEYPLQKYLEERLGTKGEHSHFETIDNTASKLNTLRVRVKDLERASDMWKAKADDHEDELVQIHEQRRTLTAQLTALEKECAMWKICVHDDCEQEKLLKKQALKVLPEIEVEGDSYGVPCVGGIGENLVNKILSLEKERDQLKGEVADARWLLQNIWIDMKGHNSVVLCRRRDAWLAKNPTPYDATERQKE